MALSFLNYRFTDPVPKHQPDPLQLMPTENFSDKRREEKFQKRSEISKAYWAKKKSEANKE